MPPPSSSLEPSQQGAPPPSSVPRWGREEGQRLPHHHSVMPKAPVLSLGPPLAVLPAGAPEAHAHKAWVLGEVGGLWGVSGAAGDVISARPTFARCS